MLSLRRSHDHASSSGKQIEGPAFRQRRRGFFVHRDIVPGKEVLAGTQVEVHFNVKLVRAGTRKKYLQDQNNRTFWVFGGVEDWHGIPLDMMQAEERQKTDGILIIAKRNRSNIDIYWGTLRPLLENKRLLCHTKKGDYQFNLRERGAKLIIHELPDLTLCKLGDAPYSETEKTTDKSIEKVGVLLRKLSPEARKHFV